MRSASARVLREDDQHDLSREAVLLQWERKIEAGERRPGPVEREARDGEGGRVAELRVAEDATHDDPSHFDRHAAPVPVAAGERRTITITGQATAPRRRSMMDSQMAQPDRIALWAFLLGLFLVAVAAGTAHA